MRWLRTALPKSGIIEMAPASSHADFTAIGDLMFRGVLTQPSLNKQLVEYARDAGAQKIAILYANDDVGVSTMSSLQQNLKLPAAKWSVPSSLQRLHQDFAPYITKFKAAGADMLYLYSQYSDAAMILNQMHDLDFDVPVIDRATWLPRRCLTSAATRMWKI